MLLSTHQKNGIDIEKVERNHKNGSIRDMTVCVAALAENGKKLVVASDNMVTLGIGTTIQYQKEDRDHKKIVRLNDHVFALTAGTLHIISPIIKLAKESIDRNTKSESAAEIIRESVQKFCLNKIEEEILKKVGFDWDYYKNKQNQLNPDIVKDLYNKISNFSVNVSIIVAGVDGDVPYLGLISGNSVLFDKTLESFLTNGGGGDLAKFSLIINDYSKSLSLSKVEEIVRKAISDAQKSPGVGELGEILTVPSTS